MLWTVASMISRSPGRSDPAAAGDGWPWRGRNGAGIQKAFVRANHQDIMGVDRERRKVMEHLFPAFFPPRFPSGAQSRKADGKDRAAGPGHSCCWGDPGLQIVVVQLGGTGKPAGVRKPLSSSHFNRQRINSAVSLSNRDRRARAGRLRPRCRYNAVQRADSQSRLVGREYIGQPLNAVPSIAMTEGRQAPAAP